MLARNWVNKISGPKFDLLESPFAASHGRR
jgi:hypothetical protein